MHVIPLITIAYIYAVLLPTYHIYLYKSSGVYFVIMILSQHLNQSGIYFFLVTGMQVPWSIGVSVVRSHHIYKTMDSTH